MTGLRIILLALLSAIYLPSMASEQGGLAPGGSSQCLECHDFGPESPVHEVLGGSHGDMDQGCEGCHGPSAAHANAPTQVSPGLSFGPRWTATSAAQDAPCLSCHEDDVAGHWRDTLHMLNNLTCITCHDIHTAQDPVQDDKQQAQVCTVCHKAQKQGIHGMQRRASRNPPCTECHNPHRQESAREEMLHNHSAGCSNCHDLVRMASRSSVSDKAKSYHKVMASPGSTCQQCHQGIAHAPADSVPPMEPQATGSGTITLFYPGAADSSWLLESHPGSQPLRQGTNCQRCHRGEEAALGEARGADIEPVSRQVQLSFSREEDHLNVVLTWEGPGNDSAISLMWGGQENTAYSHGGCFAACHSDMPGMTRDRGQQTTKYLAVSRAQQQGIGQPPLTRGPAALSQLVAQGEFAELWRVNLDTGTVETSRVLAGVDWQATDLIQINKSHRDGRWHVELRRNLADTRSGVDFNTSNKYTFGIALHGKDNPGSEHWVSLPITLGFDSKNTDFTAK